METISPDDAAWLAGTEGLAWLERVAGAAPTPAVVGRLRAELSATRVAALLEVSEARARGVTKFADADRLLLTRRGVEQATDARIAAYKASRFARFDSVVDVGCGVGGDLMALSAASLHTVGVEGAATLACFAQHNLRLCDADTVVHHYMADDDAVEGFEAWHVDPDRRPGGRRTIQLEASSPSLAQIDAWRSRQPNFAAKLAPAATAPAAWRATCELEWISRAGECRQQVAWGGGMADAAGLRRATRVDGSVGKADGATVSFVGEPGVDTPPADGPSDYLFEPDPAVLAADLTGALAHRYSLGRVGGVAYLTGDEAIDDPLLATFRTIETMTLDRRRLTQWLRARCVGVLEIKCRGVDVAPERLRAELKPKGDAAMTLLVCPTAGNARKLLVIAAERVGGRKSEGWAE